MAQRTRRYLIRRAVVVLLTLFAVTLLSFLLMRLSPIDPATAYVKRNSAVVTQEQIDEARKMNAALDAIPAWKRYARRAANAIGGIGDTVAAAPVLGAEYGVQAGKNIDATLKNWKQVEQEVKGDEHAQNLFDLLTDVDMDYNPTWPESRNRELISMGYNSKEIREMRQKLAGLEVSDGIDKNQSVGYQLYDRGQRLTAAAQSGLSPTQRAVAGAVTSAAENLAVAGVNPAAVLPVLSAQGAAEAMGQSAEKGESAGKALGGGLAKFGAGWAINSVGAADLAKTMGSDYAKDTLAGQIADWVQGLAGSSELAQRYPAVAAAISGGIDNSMQAFAETYADMAIDAALGDSEAAKNLFSKDTFLTALESGLSGGASGALGGAVGSRLRSMSEALDRATAPTAASGGNREELLGPRPAGYEARPRAEIDAGSRNPGSFNEAADASADRALAGNEPSQSAAPTAPPEGRATGVPGSSELDAGSAAGRKMTGAATEASGVSPSDVKYSIQTDMTGKKYVQIDSDILDGVAPEAQMRVVRDAIRDLFPDGFERDGKHIDNTREGRGEFVRSKYTRGLEKAAPETHADKMRMAANLDEIIQNTEDVRNEAAVHNNAESFNRGKINVRIGANSYSADVLTAIKNDGREVAYDVVNIQPTTIEAPEGNASEASGSLRGTIASSAETDDRGHPETPLDLSAGTTTQQSVGSESGESPKEVAKGLRSPMSAASDPGVYVRNVVVDPSATAEAQQAPMDAASDPRDTPETLADLPSAKTNIAPEGGVVNGRSYAEETLTADESALDAGGWASGEQKAAAAQLARAGRVSTQGVQTIVDNMPGGIGAGVYTQAAKALYRMGVNEVGSFAEALKLTGPEGSMGGAVRQVLALAPENVTVHTLALKKGADLYAERMELPSADDVAQMLAGAEASLRAAGYTPYYLYRQKYMSGSFENIGWCRPGTAGLYNIYMMEEMHSIVSLGGGAMTKINLPDGRLERFHNPKFPQQYLERIDDVLTQKDAAFRLL